MFYKPQKGIVDIYYFNTDLVADNALEYMYDFLNDKEIEIFNRYLSKRRKIQYVAGRWLLKSVLGYLTGNCPQNVDIKKNVDGKLFIEHYESENSEEVLKFNLSHSGGMVVCAVGLGNEIGVDIELMSKRIEGAAVSFFSKQEEEYLKEVAPQTLKKEVYRIWTLKEAFFKAHGCGLKVNLEDFCVFECNGAEIFSSEIPGNYLISAVVLNENVNTYSFVLREIFFKEA